MEEAQIDNRQKPTENLRRCAVINIVLNEDKQQTGWTAITFHGHTRAKDGWKADEAKVQAIGDMTAPTDVTGVQRLCGMVQYIAETTEPICALTRKDTPFVWSMECESAFDIYI